jgi:hypothetical protein
VRREALLFEWRWETCACGLSQQPVEAGGSLSREVSVRVGAAPTKPGCVSTARWRGSGEHDREEYVRNWWCKASQRLTGSNLADLGREWRIPNRQVGELLGVGEARPRGGRAEGLRRRHGEAAGAESGSSWIE